MGKFEKGQSGNSKGRPKKDEQQTASNFSDYEFEGNGLIDEELKYGKKLFENYRENFHIDNFSDLRLLEELCRRETYQEMAGKLRTELIRAYANQNKDEQEKIEAQVDTLPSSDDNLEQIMILKEKLGLFREKNTNDPFKYMEILKKKFEIWKSKNQASRTRMCPHCSKMIMFNMRMEEWDVKKHPYFVDKLLANEVMWRWVREGKITKEDLAEALNSSADYIDEIEKRLFKK